MERNYPRIIISKEGEKWLDKGQMWLFNNNVIKIHDSIENGEIVDIYTKKGRYMGTGFYQKFLILMYVYYLRIKKN